MFIFEILKAVLFGIVEGITEWLPVSSTGHIILLDEFIKLNASEEFKSMFDVVIQLGAILAVIVIFWGSIASAVLSLALLLAGGFLLMHHLVIDRGDEDYWMEES